MTISTRFQTFLLPLVALGLFGCGQGQLAIPTEEPTATLMDSGGNRPLCCQAPDNASAATDPEPTPTVVLVQGPKDQKPGTQKPTEEPAVAQPTPPGGEFVFPASAEGTLLRKLLPPQVPFSEIAERTKEPRRKPGPQELENPSGFTTPALTGIARLAPLSRRGSPAPSTTLIESLPLDPVDSTTPVPVEFRLEQRTRSDRLDPSHPPELPYLGAFVPDRAGLDDATREMSLEAVLIAPIPVRSAPVPFARQSIPDPFENRRIIQFTQLLIEPDQPISGTPLTP